MNTINLIVGWPAAMIGTPYLHGGLHLDAHGHGEAATAPLRATRYLRG